jgi:hypothetical protein
MYIAEKEHLFYCFSKYRHKYLAAIKRNLQRAIVFRHCTSKTMISTIGQRDQRAAGTPRMAVMIRLYRLVDSQQDATNGHPLSLAGKNGSCNRRRSRRERELRIVREPFAEILSTVTLESNRSVISATHAKLCASELLDHGRLTTTLLRKALEVNRWHSPAFGNHL